MVCDRDGTLLNPNAGSGSHPAKCLPFGDGNEKAMKTTAALLVLMAIIAVFVATVRTPRLSNRRQFFGFALIAFVTAQIALAVLANQVGLQGPSSLAGVFAGALAPKDARPVLAILGSSYSSRGLDGDLLERLLAQRGLDLRVAQLTYPGAYAYEQDYLFERYLRSGATVPAVVLVELGSEGGVSERPENRFKPATLSYRDAERTAAMLRQIWRGPASSGSDPRLTASLDVILHCLGHYSHLGFLHSAVLGQPRPLTGFLPEQSDDHAPTPETIVQQLEQSAEPVLDPAVSVFRAAQASAWRRRGVRDIIFFQPPLASVERRAGVGGNCRALAPDCIAIDAALTAALAGSYWTDLGHLNRAGAQRWTYRLAETLAADARIRNALH